MKTNYMQDVLNGSNFFGQQEDKNLCSLVQKDEYFTTRHISMKHGDWFNDPRDHPKPSPKSPPIGDDYIKDKPQPPIGDKPCIKPGQVAYRPY